MLNVNLKFSNIFQKWLCRFFSIDLPLTQKSYQKYPQWTIKYALYSLETCCLVNCDNFGIRAEQQQLLQQRLQQQLWPLVDI